jgi:hypothetical protein
MLSHKVFPHCVSKYEIAQRASLLNSAISIHFVVLNFSIITVHFQVFVYTFGEFA